MPWPALSRLFHSESLPSIRIVLLFSVALRIALIVYSEWHDAHSVVKYTDIDYHVFTDAARFILRSSDSVAEGPLGSFVGIGEYVMFLELRKYDTMSCEAHIEEKPIDTRLSLPFSLLPTYGCTLPSGNASLQCATSSTDC
jgi:hypothetical protein